MNILIVEDSRFLRLANERAPTKAGHNVISVPVAPKDCSSLPNAIPT